MANYDDVIEKNRRYLTNAQVNALVAASKEYNVQNAGKRASALASAREQYDVGYRGLQNMGLAGGVNAAPTSGEVPRLKTQLQVPFEDYNRRLREVENKRLNALGGQFAQQTQQAQAAAAAQQAAAKAAQEEAMRQAQLRAAAELQTRKNEKKLLTRVINNNRPTGAKGISSSDLTTTKLYDEPYEAPAKPVTREQTVNSALSAGMKQAVSTPSPQLIAAAQMLGISSPANKVVNKVTNALSPILNQKTGVAHTDDELDIANNILQATKDNLSKGFDMDQAQKDLEAAQKKVDAMASVRDTSARPGVEEAYQQAVQQRDVAKLKVEDPKTYSYMVVANSNADPVTKRMAGTKFINEKFTDDAEDAAMKYKTAQDTVNRMEAEYNKSKPEGPELSKVNDAIEIYYSAVKAYEDTAGNGAPSAASREPINKANELLNSLGFKSIHAAERYRDSLKNTEEPEGLTKARDDLAAAELRYKDPDTYRALEMMPYKDLLKQTNPDVIKQAEEKVADYQMKSMGIKTRGMSDEEYEAAKNDIKGINATLRKIESAQFAYDNAGEAETEDVVSDKEHAKEDLDAAVRELQEKYGMTYEEAKAFTERFETEKDARLEYDYYKDGMVALLDHSGEKPTKPVNTEETDDLYRSINGLPTVNMAEPDAVVPSSYDPVANFMTQDQKDAYNAIYEKDGIEAADKYFKEITPILNIQRAMKDEAYYKQLADEHPILADLRSIGASLLYNMPAAIDRLAHGAVNLFTDKYYDTKSDLSYRSARADIIRSERSQNILNNMNRAEWVNNALNFAYQTGMSMADSAVAMTFAHMGADWMVDALFFSSAGNAAYKEARERGATQTQAMEVGILSGAAEAIFEHASIEHFMKLDYKGKGALIKNLLAQSFVEGSEEVSTELANAITDAWVMRDKSKYNEAVKQYESQGMTHEQAQNKAFLGQLADIGMAGIGGFVSGGLFALGGAAVNSVKFNKEGKRLSQNTQAKDRVIQLAEIMGGNAQEALDAYNADPTNRTLGELSATVQTNMQEMFGKGNEAPDVSKASVMQQTEGVGNQMDLDTAVRNQIIDQATAYSALLSGDKMNAATAQTILDVLGAEKLQSMGYNTASAMKLMSSYNKRLDQFKIQSRADALANRMFEPIRSSYQSQLRQTPSSMGATRVGSALTQTQERATAANVTRAENMAVSRVWENPTQGLAQTVNGRTITPMPGNLTAVSLAEQQRNNFKANATATNGKVTYAVAGMQAREGMSNEQTLSEIKKSLTKEARAKADFYEKLSKALGLKMTIHDVMVGTNGFIDENGNMHVVLSGKQSVLRVAAHELTHYMKENAASHYADLRDYLIKDVGQEKFDRMIKQKAREYGIDLSTKTGQTIADDEVCAELCERMLSDTDAIERFAEQNTAAAKTLKDHLVKILNAIKAALKDAKNRDFGESWSDMVTEQETIDKWITGLDAAIQNAEKNTQANATQTTQSVSKEETDELYRSVDDIRAEEAKKAAEESAKKKTYVPGFKAAEVERVLEAGVFGDKSNYEGDDYEQARGMIAQLIPDIVSALKGDADLVYVQDKVNTVVGMMLDNYFEDEGDMASLREVIPSVIGVDSTAKTDLKAQDTSLFQMSAKMSKALGHPVTLVSEQNAKGQKNAKYSSAEKLEEVWERVRDQFGLSDDQDFSIDTTKLLDFIEQQADTRKSFNDLYGKQRQDVIAETANEIVNAVADMYSEKTGKRFSLDTDYMRLAEKYKAGTATVAETEQLQRAVEQAAREAGYSDKMYHGSRKGGGFTVFKGWQYFTPNETYAKRYAQRNNPNSMYSVFVKADNYFDTRKAAAKRLFEKYRQEYGLGELQENGLPDWTDGYDLAEIIEDNDLKYDGIILDEGGDMVDGKPVSRGLSYVIRDSAQVKSADPVAYDDKGNIIPLSDRFRTDRTGNESWKNKDIRYDLDTDELRETFTHIDTEALDNGLESLKNVTPGKGLWAIKDISRFLDSVAGGNKELRDNLTKIFETPHRQALKNYATGVSEMQKKVLDIGTKAGVCDSKGHHFDSKKSAAIQNIGEGFSNRHTDVSVRMVDADAVRVTATDKETGKALGTKDYTFRELRGAYGREVADQLWSEAFDAAQEVGKPVDVEREVNTQPYTLDDLKAAYPQDWQKLKTAADEFRTMYDEYIRNINNMLETIYPNASKYATVDKITEAIEKKQQRLADRKAAYNIQIENLQKSLEAKEQEIASKKRTDTKAFRELVDQANQIKSKIADAQAEIAEYEANVKDELTVMGEEKALMQNAEREGDSLGRMHRLEYRSDYFHHFTEMTSGVQNLKSIFTGNTDISPAVVGKSDTTKPKSRWAGFFQKRQGGDYTADALNGMLRYGQLAEYKLAFDPFAAYLRDVENKVVKLDKNATNRDNLIRYIQQWTNTILGKSHTIDRALVDSGIGMRSKMFKALSWINSRVIQNTLLWNMRSALIQISNVTNAKGIVTNNLDWANGLRKWALAARGNSEMQSIMNQSTFLASRYMDNLQLTDSVFKSAKQFAGWMLGALDEVSAKATWWAAYTQYQRNPNAKVIQNAYRTYDNAIDYADDVTRRTHAGRGVGELAPAMTSRVINLVAPFQVEVNNTYQLLKDNVKQKNYLGLLSTGLSVFALNTIFEAIVGSTPLGFDFIRAIVDIAFGIAGDDPEDDDDDYGVGRAVQRLAGEFVGGLPYANQIVGLIGKDNAEKIIGSDTDVTRYGNTQIGLNAMMNTVAGVSDLFNAAKDGKNLFTETNFISDIDDLLNIIMPMGAKQLTRTAEGLMTVAKGYGGKADKQGNEKVQFVADQDLVNWLHAGLFGKWALTQASEYFDEERLLPKLFGVYEGPKSATGQLIDAKEYKAALETGIDGKQFFTLKDDMKGYSTQGGKRAELMQQDFTPEQKAKLDALMVPSKDAEMKVEGTVVYQKSGEDWKVKADYSNQDMFDLSQAGDKAYTGTLEAMEKTGLPQDQAALAASMWDQAKQADDSKTEFRNLLMDNKNLTVAQKEALDLQYCGNKYPADYSDPDLYELSLDGNNRSTYEKAKQAKAQGVPVKTYTSLADKKKEHEGEGQAAYMRQEIMKTNLTAKQKELMDDLLVSDSGRNPDYSSQAWFDVSMLGKTQYETAQEGAKVGLKPEVYLEAYKKYKEIQAKDENGKYINNKRKAKELMKEYLDKLPITAPVYDYIWYNVFKQKKK